MFTGLIQHVGRVHEVRAQPWGASLLIDPMGWSHAPAHGESIAVNGCCLTVADSKASTGRLTFDVVHQTLKMTAMGEWRGGEAVNLEHAATPATLLGGHIVQGHVDGVGVIRSMGESGGERRLRIEPHPGAGPGAGAGAGALMEFIVDQGSIAVDGVSLTIAAVGADWFEVALISMTLKLTTLGRASVGARVNLETDCLAKMIVTWLKRQRGGNPLG